MLRLERLNLRERGSPIPLSPLSFHGILYFYLADVILTMIPSLSSLNHKLPLSLVDGFGSLLSILNFIHSPKLF